MMNRLLSINGYPRCIHPRSCSVLLKAVADIGQQYRSFSSNEEAENPVSKYKLPTKQEISLLARDYNLRRANYNRQVKMLRIEYSEEYEQLQVEERARKKAEREKLRREKLIRQRKKNIRSVQNMKKQEQFCVEQDKKFQIHLEEQQKIRNEKNHRYQRARQMIVSELEEESEHWLTTVDEVENAFDDWGKTQELWARPNGGILGAPSPSIDSAFWNYECHTFDMEKSYTTQRQVVLDEVLENTYHTANVDYEVYWNVNDRLLKQIQLENKAQLRAMVRMEGRKILLQKQRDILVTQYGNTNDESNKKTGGEGNDDTPAFVPKIMPAPNVKILANIEAMEEEGAKALLKDPTKYFEFDSSVSNKLELEDAKNSVSYTGPSLGKPLRLRNWMVESSLPRAIAKMEKPDTRTPAQKKRAEREQKMWAAARKEEMAAAQENEGMDDVELAAAQMDAEDLLEKPIDYDVTENEWDKEDNDEWMKGLDPIMDRDVLENTPHDKRLSKDDIQWIIEQIERKIVYLDHQLAKDVSSYRYKTTMSSSKEDSDNDTTASSTTNDSATDIRMQNLLSSLTDEQVIALAEIDDKLDYETLSDHDLTVELKKVPNLSEDKIRFLLQIDDNDDVKK